MLLAEKRHAMIAGHGIRILPQIKVKCRSLRKNPALHIYIQLQFGNLHVPVFHGNASGISSRSSVTRDLNTDPHRACAVRSQPQIFHLMVYAVCHERRVKLRIDPVAAASLSVLVQFIRHHISHKIRLHG